MTQPSSSIPSLVSTPTSVTIQSAFTSPSPSPSPSPSDTNPHFTRRPSPSPSASGKSDRSPEGRRQQQRSSSTWRPYSQPSSPSPPGSREEYTTLTISSSISSSLPSGASQTQKTPAQEVSETITPLQTEKPQEEAQKDLEYRGIPIVRTIPDETPLSEIANAHAFDEISKLRQNPDKDTETQESKKISILPQVKEESEIVLEHQEMLIEGKTELDWEENMIGIEITDEIDPIKQDPESTTTAIHEDKPKIVDFKAHKTTTTDDSDEESNGKTELNSSTVQPDSTQTLIQPETEESSKQESMNGLSGKEQTNMVSDVPQASPETAGDNFHNEIKGDSNSDEKMNCKHPREARNEHTRRIIYLAGKNHGASVYIGQDEELMKVNKVVERKEQSKVHVATYKEESQVVNDDVLSSMRINCNVQNINSSILHESSCSQDKPGVHLIFSIKPAETFN